MNQEITNSEAVAEATGLTPLAKDLTQVATSQARAPFALAIDIGTSSVRAAVYDARGRLVNETLARRVCRFQMTADGGAEAEAESFIQTVESAIDEAVEKFSVSCKAKIEGLGVSCFWHSLVGVDEHYQPQTPLYAWADTRAASAVENLLDEFDENETHNRTGCRFHSSYWTAKLRWLKETQPEIFRRIKRWLSLADLLLHRLCESEKPVATSVCMASGTGLMNLRASAWDAELCQAFGLGESNLPRIVETHESFALSRDSCARWSLLSEAKVYPAIGDGAANTIGAGCTTRDEIALMIGTSGAMRVLFRGAPPRELPLSCWCYRLDRERVIIGGALSDGGGLYEWLMKRLQIEAATNKEIERMSPDAHGLTILPFWGGERSTGWNKDARGAMLGLTMNTQTADIVRAAMEAVAYRFRMLFDDLIFFAPNAKVFAAGGALQASSVWTQITADVLERNVYLSEAEEASCRGAALYALEGLGALEIEKIKPLYEQEFKFNAATRAAYLRGRKRQQLLYKLLTADTEAARVIAGGESKSF